jgi:hypothetical protein
MKVRTLLAVTLATAAPAAAGPEHAHHNKPSTSKVTPAKPAAKPAPKPAAAPAAPAAPVVAAKPRTLPNGAPACGNVQGKMSREARAKIDECRAKQAEAAKAEAKK